MTINTDNLTNYITKVCKEACASENRPVDVKFQYTIINDMFVFAMHSKYTRVSRRIRYRINNNLKKNFGLTPCDVVDMGSLINYCYGIDTNYSFTTWEVFGELYTLRAWHEQMKILNPHMCDPFDDPLKNRYHALVNAGYQPKTVGKFTSEDWENFCHYYEKAFGDHPYEVKETYIIDLTK